MKRVMIIGNAGGGKSKLARAIAADRELPYFAIDHLQWQPNWIATPEDIFDAQHRRIVLSDEWVLDGCGSIPSVKARIEACDTIVFVDLPFRVHLWWATKRQFRSLFVERADGPEGCPMWRVTFRLYPMMWRMQMSYRAILLDLLNFAKSDKQVIHVRTAKDLALIQKNPQKLGMLHDLNTA